MSAAQQFFMHQSFRNLLKWMPVSWKAALEFRFDKTLGNEFAGPFNGQTFRQSIFKDLTRSLNFAGIVETGTFRGITTAYMAENSEAKIFSVEFEPRFYHYAKWNLRKHKKVTVRNDDSRKFLEGLIRDTSVPKSNVFFYLDAHWNDDLPLYEEVKLIAENWTDVVIMIDDFEVPDDPEYKFDDYGDGKQLNLDYIGSELLANWAVYFPKGRGSEDTGIKRGCVVLASPGLEQKVDGVPSLRPYSAEAPASIGRG